MKSKEEYLIKYEENLLSKLDQNYTQINKYLILIYTTALTLLLLDFRVINETKYFDFDVKLTQNQQFIFVPLLIVVFYLLLNNALNNIMRIITKLHENAQRLKAQNGDALPFDLSDLDIYSQGITGLQYHFAKWVAKRYLNPDVFNISFSLPEAKDRKTKILFSFRLPLLLFAWLRRFSNLMLRTLIVMIMLIIYYVLPLISILALINNSSLHFFQEEFRWSQLNWLHFCVSLLLVFIIIYTFICNWKLYAFYQKELSEIDENLKDRYILDLINGPKKIWWYYFGTDQL